MTRGRSAETRNSPGFVVVRSFRFNEQLCFRHVLKSLSSAAARRRTAGIQFNRWLLVGLRTAALVDPRVNRLPQSKAPRSLCVLRRGWEHTGVARVHRARGTILAQNAGAAGVGKGRTAGSNSSKSSHGFRRCNQSCTSLPRSCKRSPRCEATSDESSAGSPYPTFCGSRAAGDCPWPPSGHRG